MSTDAPPEITLCAWCYCMVDQKDQCYVRMSCGHVLHDKCRQELQRQKSFNDCPVHFYAVLKQANDRQEYALDTGSDQSIRAMCMRPVAPYAWETRALLSSAQPVILPSAASQCAFPASDLPPMMQNCISGSDGFAAAGGLLYNDNNSSTSSAPSGGLLATISAKLGTLRGAKTAVPDTAFTDTNQKAYIDALLFTKAPPEVMKRVGVSMSAIIACGITWDKWESKGYGVSDAVALGADWSTLVDMRFGESLRDSGDYDMLHYPPLNLTFPAIFSAVWQSQWSALGKQRCSAVVLKKLGLNFEHTDYTLMTLEDLQHLNYLSLTDFNQHLGLTPEIFMKWNPSKEFLEKMKWTEQQLRTVMKISVQRPQAPAVPLVPPPSRVIAPPHADRGHHHHHQPHQAPQYHDPYAYNSQMLTNTAVRGAPRARIRGPRG